MIVLGLILFAIGIGFSGKSARLYKTGILLTATGTSMVMITLGISLSDVQIWLDQMITYK